MSETLDNLEEESNNSNLTFNFLILNSNLFILRSSKKSFCEIFCA